MTPEQRAYIDSRRRQIRYWPWMAAVLVLLVVAGYGWLWQNVPVNLNPQLVLEQFSSRVMTDEELILLAARGTLALGACGLFMLLLVVLVSVALWNEHRLIRMLDDLGGPAPAAQDEDSLLPGSGTELALDAAEAAAATPGDALAMSGAGGPDSRRDREGGDSQEGPAPTTGEGAGPEAGPPR